MPLPTNIITSYKQAIEEYMDYWRELILQVEKNTTVKERSEYKIFLAKD